MKAKMKGKWFLRTGLLLFLVCLAIGTPTVKAQTRAPLLLIITDNGSVDLWAWSGADQPLKRLTNDGYIFSPAISPDGKYVAYNSVPEFARVDCSGWPPSDIWLLDIATGNAVPIAEQPPNPSFCEESKPSSFIRRPKPTWSPDSKALAWGESEITPRTKGPTPNRLVIYNLEKKKQQVIVANLPGNQNITHGQEVDWGDPGIANVVFPVPFDQTFEITDVYIYRTNGTLLFRQRLYGSRPCLIGNRDSQWVKGGSKSLLDICIDFVDNENNERQVLIDPLTLRQSELSGHAELYSPIALDALGIFSAVGGDSVVTWHITFKGQIVKDIVWGSTRNDFYAFRDRVAISSDGQRIAYHVNNRDLFIYNQNGQTIAVQLPLGKSDTISWIGWGPTAWRIRR
jgi:hypothetical protein